jgi:hypothetical protein
MVSLEYGDAGILCNRDENGVLTMAKKKNICWYCEKETDVEAVPNGSPVVCKECQREEWDRMDESDYVDGMHEN